MKFYLEKIYKSVHFKRIAILLLSLFILVIILGLSFRGWVLNEITQRVDAKLERDYGQQFSYDKKGFRGLTRVYFENIRLNSGLPSVDSRTEKNWLTLSEVEVSLSLWNLLINRVKLNSLQLGDAHFYYFEKDSVSNLDAFLKRNPIVNQGNNPQNNRPTSSSFSKKLENLWDLMSRFVPENLEIHKASILLEKDSVLQNFELNDFLMKNRRFSTDIKIDDVDAFRFNGQVNFDKNTGFLQVIKLQQAHELNFLKDKFNLSLSFDTLDFELNSINFSKNSHVEIQGHSQMRSLKILQPRISIDTVHFPFWSGSWKWNIGEESIELAQGTEIKLQNATLFPQFFYQKVQDSLHFLTADLRVPLMPAQDFFDAFPKGLFSTLDGIRVKGKLGFEMQLELDERNLDSLKFNSQMLKEDFLVNSWGQANPNIMNSSFLHEPYEENFSPASFWVGPSNPNYVGLSQISPYFKNTILTTEDPSFFYHGGFVLDAFKESIITNFKEKAFVRGGSTISMQLIKNIFLHRNKTITRKLEEVLLVWLMENPRQVSKEKQFETYLNIIEFGYNVYGIGPGSRHYFAKHPSQLTLGESIFLASIVPKPKRGMYYFNEYGMLKESIKPYFTYIGNIMARRGLIEEDFTGDYGFSTVRLREGIRPLPPEEAPFSLDSLVIEIPRINITTQN